jgi:hypothetical protein
VISVIEHDYAIKAVVMDKKLNLKLRLGTMYGPAHEEKREQFLRELSIICAKNDLPMII